MQTEIIAKATGTTTTTSANVIELNAPSVVRLDLDRSQVAAMEREGNDLIIRLTDGQTIRIDNFYDQQQGRVSDLVLRDDQGGQWLAHPSASGSGRGATRRPHVSSMISSGPPIRVVMTGSPACSASMKAMPKGSGLRLG